MKNTSIVQNETLILDLLNDTLLFSRMCNTMSIALHKKTEWCEIFEDYKGLNSAFYLLGIVEDSDIYEEMHSIFIDYADSDIEVPLATKSLFYE